MIVVSLLAASALITSARASPTSDWLLLYDLYNQRSLETKDPSMGSSNDVDRNYPMEIYLRDDVAEIDNERDPNLSRTKKLGLGRNSLSIVNPVDVLRQRVLLELSRRKAMQDQRQVDANRRMLASVGKRSIKEIRPNYATNTVEMAANSPKNRVYSNDVKAVDGQQINRPYTQRIPIDDTHEWYNVDDSAIRENRRENGNSNRGDDETRKVLFNYHHDRV